MRIEISSLVNRMVVKQTRYAYTEFKLNSPARAIHIHIGTDAGWWRKKMIIEVNPATRQRTVIFAPFACLAMARSPETSELSRFLAVRVGEPPWGQLPEVPEKVPQMLRSVKKPDGPSRANLCRKFGFRRFFGCSRTSEGIMVALTGIEPVF